MAKVYIYVVDRDLGFAPNPFHGICTLATCKARIRNSATIGDWIFGLGGGRLKATGKCVFAMKVTRIVSYNEYWGSDEFNDKKPVRNGSKVMTLGDNIYHFDTSSHYWQQANSHHSNSDGTINDYNLEKDTKSTKVLLSTHFYYFGRAAQIIPTEILDGLGYANKINHRVFDLALAIDLVRWIEKNYGSSVNLVLADPFNFDKSSSHYSYETNRISGT